MRALLLLLLLCLPLAACAGLTRMAGDPEPSAMSEPAAAAPPAASAAPTAPSGPRDVTEAKVICWGKVEREKQRVRTIDQRIAYVEKCVADQMRGN